VMERFDDSAVYAIRPSQVVGVYDQIFHNLSRSFVYPCPLGQLLICATA